MTAAQRALFKKNYDDNLSHFRALLSPAETVTFKIAHLPGDGGILPSLKFSGTKRKALL